ncbi:MAG: hypothetical protein ACI9S8_001491 [Chlamydiales bacterium]|jgi:hypothetical protein
MSIDSNYLLTLPIENRSLGDHIETNRLGGDVPAFLYISRDVQEKIGQQKKIQGILSRLSVEQGGLFKKISEVKSRLDNLLSSEIFLLSEPKESVLKSRVKLEEINKQLDSEVDDVARIFLQLKEVLGGENERLLADQSVVSYNLRKNSGPTPPSAPRLSPLNNEWTLVLRRFKLPRTQVSAGVGELSLAAGRPRAYAESPLLDALEDMRTGSQS